MVVCHCRGINERDVRQAVRNGAGCHQDVANACGAGTGCGGCVPLVHQIIESERHGTVNIEIIRSALLTNV